MHIAALFESNPPEQRVAITPEIAEKLIAQGHQVSIETKAGNTAGFLDENYRKVGVHVHRGRAILLGEADVIFCISPFGEKNLKEKATVIGLSNNKAHQAFNLELLPRITRAQFMDVLSSQNSLAGYQAVLEGAYAFNRAIPMMTTAAGTIPPAQVLVLGAGVAGLQAIATAKRLGAVVSAYDVRSAAKEQVESLGASFLSVDFHESGDGKGGYAKEMSLEYQQAQTLLLKKNLPKYNIIICSAQIPGKKAPMLLTQEMVQSLFSGSVIVDAAIETGGNCESSVLGKVVVKHGVTIVGYTNLASRLAYDASRLLAKNFYHFFGYWIENRDRLADDEILTKTFVPNT